MNDPKYRLLIIDNSHFGLYKRYQMITETFDSVQDAKIKILELCLNDTHIIKDFKIVKECDCDITDVDFDIYKKIVEAGE